MVAARADDGVATPVEMMYLLVFCLASALFLGFLGRLHAAGVEVTNTAQAAARAASLELDPASAGRAASSTVVASALHGRCNGGTRVSTSWAPSASGTWRGGAVTVSVSCTIRNQSLTGVWVPGSRTVVMSDTQPVDRYRR